MALSKENLVHLESILEIFGDPSFNTPFKKLASYQQVKDILDSAKDVNGELLDRLLQACTADLKPDVGYLPNVLNAVVAILKKRQQSRLSNLVPSAQAIVYTINSIATLSRVGSLPIVSVKTMCFDTLLAYPDETLETLVKVDSAEIRKIIELHCSTVATAEYKRLAFGLLIRLMKTLSPETKSAFVTGDVDVWFAQMLPAGFTLVSSNVNYSAVCIEALEIVTATLLPLDYSDNPHWLRIIDSIYDLEKYPALIKNMLDKRNELWHRIWIILIRLLKEQITKITHISGSPINALLPIVEKAFKMDVHTRILAFKCWDALIDNFSSEKDEAFVLKRLKLLTIPLKSPNAKTEEVAEAKINTWWRLIRKYYYNKIAKLTNIALITFIHCCFGHPEKDQPIPGMMSDKLTATCIQIFVEIFGHVNCDGCVTIPPLKGRFLNTVVLVEHWTTWLQALKAIIKFTATHESPMLTRQLTCIWKSLLLSLAELPANQIRNDIFEDVLTLIERLLQCDYMTDLLANQIYDVMITSMFDREESVINLLSSREGTQNRPIPRILKVLFDPVMERAIQRKTHKDLRLITDALLNKAICHPTLTIEWLLHNLPHGENSAVLWSALVESICQTEFPVKDMVQREMILWPLTSCSSLMSERSAQICANWKTIFSSYNATLTESDYDDILELVQNDYENAIPAVNFKMCVCLTLLKLFAVKSNYTPLKVIRTLDLISNLLGKVSSYKEIENVFPMFMDTLVLIIKTQHNDPAQVVAAEKILKIIHVLINLTAQEELPSNGIKRFLLKPMNDMFQNNEFVQLKYIVVDDLINYLATNKENLLSNNILEILKTILSKCKDNEKDLRARVESAICRAGNKIQEGKIYEVTDPIPNKTDTNLQNDTSPEIIDITSEGNDEVTLLRKPKKVFLVKLVDTPKVTITPVKTINKTDYQSKNTPAKVIEIVDDGTNKTVSSNVTPVKIIKKPTDATKVTPAKMVDTKATTSQNHDPMKTKMINSPNSSLAKTRRASKLDTPTVPTKNNVENTVTEGEKSHKVKDSCIEITDDCIAHNDIAAPVSVTTEIKTPAEANALTPELAKLFDKQNKVKNEFITPSDIEPKKSSKRKVPSIVNTVTENGEEYEVVKSHWKFNPRKLTEHQKEKLREKKDIPALYQDLSQSQDEIKLGTWKTDSQDTTTTSKSNSNSNSNKDISAILKNLPSSDVLPKIMKNMLSEKVKDPQANNKNNDSSIKEYESPAVKIKCPRTPRMSLKDRVFKNMQNLIVKTGSPDNALELLRVANSKTPDKSIITTTVTNSAPSKISSERPSRLIKPPRKFVDSELMSIKKRRRSIAYSQPDSPVELIRTESTSLLTNDSPAVSVTAFPASSEIEESQPTDRNTTEVTQISGNKVVTESINLKTSEPISVHNNNSIENNEPKPTRDKGSNKTITPKSTKKQSRIEKQLLIDMVEGHPVLQPKTPPRGSKRFLSVRKRTNVDKKSINREQPNSLKNVRNRIIANDTISEQPAQKKKRGRPAKATSQSINIDLADKTTSFTVLDSQNTQEKSPMSKSPSQDNSPTSSVSREKSSTSSVSSLEKSSTSTVSSQDLASSEDIIESSQDSSITTISVKSTNKKCYVTLRKKTKDSNTQDLLDKFGNEVISFNDSIMSVEKSNEDIELPKNKSVAHDVVENNLTENMDTEPFSERHSVSTDCILIEDDDSPVVIDSEQKEIRSETQEIAEADTEPFELGNTDIPECNIKLVKPVGINKDNANQNILQNDTNTQNDLTQTFIEDETAKVDVGTDFSPIRDKAQKNKEFLNDTLEISPIKTLSPLLDKNTQSPESSRDYVVIKLNSPVQSNGEPFEEKCDSPEVFTEDKTSPEKRDQSPPRDEIKVTCGSPSSLSLKKNRANIGRGSGRAAQILGLCASAKSKTVNINKEEQPNKYITPTAQKRRNLKILQNTANDTKEEPMSEDDSEENFLKLKRLVPSAECSPSVPILKRKFVDIADDDTKISPASKRKRVSFHDPPVSTTIAVHKYIEPCSMRSPQNSLVKRQERQARGFTASKSQKRLDNIFQLDTVLIKAIENFSNDSSPITPSYSEQSSIEQTPAAEVIKTSELNNTDPICPSLLDCKDPISNIASDLSSPAMKDLFIKELSGKIETVADLAKMTELEVNRLCIKAPKVKVAQQVLSAYAALRNVTMNETRLDTTSNQSKILVDAEANTITTALTDGETQTDQNPVKSTDSQKTETKQFTTSAAQTNESGNKSTEEIINSCLSDRPDFIERLRNQLGTTNLARVADNLSFDASLDLIISKTNPKNIDEVICRLLKEKGNVTSSNTITQFTELMCKQFQSNDLILLCSKILENVHNKNSS